MTSKTRLVTGTVILTLFVLVGVLSALSIDVI